MNKFTQTVGDFLDKHIIWATCLSGFLIGIFIGFSIGHGSHKCQDSIKLAPIRPPITDIPDLQCDPGAISSSKWLFGDAYSLECHCVNKEK